MAKVHYQSKGGSEIVRYKLDNAGYVCAVSFGCYLDTCTEYTGAVPTGYNNLDEWASYACIQAYYLDAKGNLVLDYERQMDLEKRQAQEAIDNSPVLKKDLYGTDESLNKQYKKATATGKVITLQDINTLEPRVKITGINPYEKDLITIYTHGKNMMPCNATSQEISGMKITVNANNSISVIGTALADIEYSILSGDTDSAFVMKKNHDYYLNLGGFKCELRWFDGETSLQKYSGSSGLLNLDNSIEVNEVILKIPFGTTVETTFFPQLEYGNKFTGYEAHKRRKFSFDIRNFVMEATLPSDTLFPSDKQYARETLFPDDKLLPNDNLIIKEKVLFDAPHPSGSVVEYILIENGTITASIDGVLKIIGGGYISLYGEYDTIYCLQESDLEIEYSTNVLEVKDLEFMQGKETTTGLFKVLPDGSIEAKNGYFSGTIEAESGYIAGDLLASVVMSEEMIANYATISSLDAQIARINAIESEYIKASVVQADYMSVANWTHAGKIQASKINVNELLAYATNSAILRVGLLDTLTLIVNNYNFTVQYSDTLHGYVLVGQPLGGV